MRNYAAVPHEYLEEMDALSDAEFGRLIRALLRYSGTGEAVALSGNERFFARRVMAQENRFQDSYAERVERRKQAGRAGAEARWRGGDGSDGKGIAAMGSHGNTETEPETETETETRNPDPDKTEPPPGAPGRREKAPPFTPPTLEEVREYVAERGSRVDPQGFLDYYQANGWMLGKTPMRDWRAACRNAERWDRWKGNKAPGPGPGRDDRERLMAMLGIKKE